MKNVYDEGKVCLHYFQSTLPLRPRVLSIYRKFCLDETASGELHTQHKILTTLCEQNPFLEMGLFLRQTFNVL